jgi:ribonucleotide reductase beta subunit family protein with ferritin-like domain
MTTINVIDVFNGKDTLLDENLLSLDNKKTKHVSRGDITTLKSAGQSPAAVRLYKSKESQLNVNECDNLNKNFENLTVVNKSLNLSKMNNMVDYKKYVVDFENEEIIDEIILKEDESRYTVQPIKYHDVWDMYKIHVGVFWVAEEVDLSKDKNDWDNKLNDNERFFLKHVLAFFAGSDKIVNINLTTRFKHDVKILEAEFFYDYQAFSENVHAETYGLLLETYINNPEEKHKLMHGITTIPCIIKKTEWAVKWIQSDKTFAHRVIAFAIVERVFFSGSFAAIFWLKHRNILSGLISANQLILRDEGLHCDFACLIYSMLQNKLKQSVVYQIVSEAVDIEKEFFINALPTNLLGMNQELMCSYIEYVADHLLVELGYDKLYNTKNPFDFMELIDIENKRNFFELRENRYQNSKVRNVDKDKKYEFERINTF